LSYRGCFENRGGSIDNPVAVKTHGNPPFSGPKSIILYTFITFNKESIKEREDAAATDGAE
jgi:hypothetical protein